MKKAKVMVYVLILCLVFATGVMAAPGITLIVNGQKADVDVKLINNVTYLPLRAVSDLLNVPIDWDGATKTVIVGSAVMKQPDGQDTPVVKDKYVGSMESDKYHIPTCQHAKKIGDTNKIWFKDAEAAKAAGYTPCAVCKP